MTKALKDSQYRHKDTAKLLGMTERQLRYCIQKNPQLIERNEV
ncbi:helix-turn-helix domain-containing protein [Mangrovimonas futianensis]